MSPNLAEATLGPGDFACSICNACEDALAAFEECLKIKPAYDNALYGKAVALQLLGKVDEAYEIYTKLLASNASNAELLTSMIGHRASESRRRQGSRVL